MWLFNTSNKMTKYNSILDIINEWYPYRYKLYVDRKAYLLRKLRKELDIIKYKVKFINEFISGTIDIRNKSKATVLQILEDKEYPKLSIKLDDDENISYDYILKMDLYKLTTEEIEELTKQRDMKELEVKELEETTIEMMWKSELDQFEAMYKKDLKNYMSKKDSNSNSKRKGKKIFKKGGKKK